MQLADYGYSEERTTGPAAEPMTPAELRTFAGIDASETDATLTADYIKPVRRDCEKTSERSLITQTWTVKLDRWPMGRTIELRHPPLQSVTSITYIDVNGASQTLAASKYTVDTNKNGIGRIVLDASENWPTLEGESPGEVTIVYVAGYGSASTDIPEDLVWAMKQHAKSRYDFRNDMVIGTIVSSSIDSSQHTYRSYRPGGVI